MTLRSRPAGWEFVLVIALILAWPTRSEAQLAAAVRHAAIPIRSIDPSDDAFADLEPLIAKIGTAQVVVLGEATHSEGATSAAKARLVRFLHQRMGFEVLAWEAGFTETARMNAALRSAVPIRQATEYLMRGGWDETIYTQPLFQYARETWSTPRPLWMAGFDEGRPPHGADGFNEMLAWLVRRAPWLAPSTQALEAARALAARVYGYLGPDTTAPPVRDYQRSVVERLASAVERDRDALRSVFSDADLRDIRVALRNLTLDDEMRGRLLSKDTAMRRSWERDRERLMATRLAFIRDSLYPGRKVIVWAATGHLVREIASIKPLDPAIHYAADQRQEGDYVAQEVGRDLYIIAFTTYGGTTGELFAVGDERTPYSGADSVPEPPAGSFEAAAHTVGQPYLFVDLRSEPVNDPLAGRFVARPLGMIPSDAEWRRHVDAFFFIDQNGPEIHLTRYR